MNKSLQELSEFSSPLTRRAELFCGVVFIGEKPNGVGYPATAIGVEQATFIISDVHRYALVRILGWYTFLTRC